MNKVWRVGSSQAARIDFDEMVCRLADMFISSTIFHYVKADPDYDAREYLSDTAIEFVTITDESDISDYDSTYILTDDAEEAEARFVSVFDSELDKARNLNDSELSNVNWTINPIAGSDEGDGPMYALLPDDGTRGIVLGELADARAASEALDRLIATGDHDGEVERRHAQLGYNWLTTGQAEAKYGVPRSSITWACRQGHIADARKRGNLWEFPEVTFRYWVMNRPRL